VRQEGADQQAFRNCLEKFRMGAVGFVEYEFLRARINGIVDSIESRRFKDSLYLMHTRAEVDSYNAKQLLKFDLLGSRTARCDAVHSCKAAEKMASKHMMGLLSFLCITKGSRVMLTSNLWTEVGLTNGAMGTAKNIRYDGCLPPVSPKGVIVEMDVGYIGPCISGMPRHVVINPKTAYCHSSVGEGSLMRTQIPLLLPFVVTIHKSQGILFLIFNTTV
jgi:ATP-dependent DNA helicase PIF1